MKVLVAHQAAYRSLPHDFEDRFASCVTTPYAELTDPAGIYDSFRWHMADIMHSVRAGFDGVGVTEHSQAAYDMVPNPSLLAAIVANVIREETRDTAVLVNGRTLGKTREPIRVAEEYAMLDALSGGRLIAGFPPGLSYDSTLNNGILPLETRARFREGYDLVMRAWSSEDAFAWNGRYSRYPMVNIWPRPVQRPHPPVWIPGTGSPGTLKLVLDLDAVYVSLGGALGPALRNTFTQFWDLVEERGLEANPFRTAFVQAVVVADSDEQAETEFGTAVERYFHHGLGSIPTAYLGLPGFIDREPLEAMIRSGAPGLEMLKKVTFSQLVAAGALIAGSPATVADQLAALVTELRVGNLVLTLQMGMSPELGAANQTRFAEAVLPRLRGIWDDDGWQHRWWPTGVGVKEEVAER